MKHSNSPGGPRPKNILHTIAIEQSRALDCTALEWIQQTNDEVVNRTPMTAGCIQAAARLKSTKKVGQEAGMTDWTEKSKETCVHDLNKFCIADIEPFTGICDAENVAGWIKA